MWEKVNGALIQTTDKSRVKFRTNISANILEQIKKIAAENNTYVNYLLENGLANLLSKGTIEYDKKTRPQDRIQYKTTYNDELLEAVKAFAAKHGLYANDVIECSIQYIDMSNIKSQQYKHRIE